MQFHFKFGSKMNDFQLIKLDSHHLFLVFLVKVFFGVSSVSSCSKQVLINLFFLEVETFVLCLSRTGN